MDESVWIVGGWILLGALLGQGAGFVYERMTRNAGIVDAVWALGTGSAAVVAAVFLTGDPWLRLLVGVCGGVWGLRLGFYLLRDRVIGQPEEGRYAYMRAAMPGWDGWGFAAFFLVQALWILLFSLPFIAVASAPTPPAWALWLGLGVWITGFCVETLADYQLARFRRQFPGALCTVGLWRHCRHPNYLGEWMTWFAWPIWGIALTSSYWLWLAPVGVYIFLRYLTGIPWTEARLARTRGAVWNEYAAKTPCLIPRFLNLRR